MKAIERLFTFFENNGLKHTPMERELGLTNGYLGKMRDRKGSIGSDILETIFCKFPDLNPDWLLTGRGSMLREKQPVAQRTSVPVISDSGEASAYYKMFEKKDEENKALLKEMGVLEERLRAKEEQLLGLQYPDVPAPKVPAGSTQTRKSGVVGSESVQYAEQ